MSELINQALLKCSKKRLFSLALINRHLITKVCLSLFLSSASFYAISQTETAPLTLLKAINIAQQNDDWLLKSEFIENGLNALSDGATALPDPVVSLSILNLPTNGFAFNQEQMTQLKVGASQQFARGNTLELQQQKHKITAKEQPFLRQDRKAKVALNAELLWLDAYYAQSSYVLVEDTRPLFDKLEEIVSANYASSVGNAGQQDIIRAELELIRLQDRLVALATQKNVALRKLSLYLFSGDTPVSSGSLTTGNIVLPNQLNEISKSDMKRLSLSSAQDDNQLYQLLLQHSLALATEQRVKALEVDTQIAKEGLKPQYAINASYALRDNAPDGQSRADFLSVGMNMSMPLFSSAKQDANISSSVQMTEAIKTEKLLLVRELLAAVKSAYAEYKGMSERLSIYQTRIIPQMQRHSDATLTAYTNDNGDFAEVVRAKIAELDAQLTLLKLEVAKHKAIATIRYYLPLEIVSYE